MKKTWGFLKEHRSFQAAIYDSPNGYKVIITMLGKVFGSAVAISAAKAMGEAVEMAEGRLREAHRQIREDAKKRLARKRGRSASRKRRL